MNRSFLYLKYLLIALLIGLISFFTVYLLKDNLRSSPTSPLPLWQNERIRQGPSCELNPSKRIECGYVGISKDQCERERGCCWSPIINQQKHLGFESQGGEFINLNDGLLDHLMPGPVFDESPTSTPWCFHTKPALECSGYQVIGDSLEVSVHKIILKLSLIDPGCSKYSKPIQNLSLRIDDLESTLRLHITDSDAKRWEIPASITPNIPRGVKSVDDEPTSTSYFNSEGTFTKEFASGLGCVIARLPRFSFSIFVVATKEVIFDTYYNPLTPFPVHVGPLIFENQYIELSTSLPKNANLYGLGEQTGSFRKNSDNARIGFWARDNPTIWNENQYGSHPFYIELRKTGSHGVYLRNSNGMDIILTPGALTYKIIGGVIELFFFLGPSPQKVIEKYTDLIGKPAMMPFWTLGFHQCRYGYNNIAEVEEVVKQYNNHKIPLDGMWIDIEYMDRYNDFTFDPINYPIDKVQRFVNNLHANGKHFVLIVDPGIKVEKGLEAYDLGVREDIFLKNQQGDYFLGKVWPGETHFPDWIHPKVQSYWDKLISQFVQLSGVDGLWIDMNELANFCDGDCRKSPQQPDELNFPPYAIRSGAANNPIFQKTVSMDVVHANGALEYDMHNLYGITEAIVTRDSLKKVRPDERTFLLSRSTFPGIGPYAAHWTGDNFSRWKDLAASIPAILDFQFSSPFVGADICGFIDDTTEELCTRWSELGSFYPFARNHNGLGYLSQEPYRWPMVAAVTRKYMSIRYSLLSFWYTIFSEANMTGSPVLQPLWFEFPEEMDITAHIEGQYMVGRSILVSPVLSQGKTSVQAYMPKGVWYDYLSHEKLALPHKGEHKLLSSNLDHMPLHILGGRALAIHQNPELTSGETRTKPFQFVIALDSSYRSGGALYMDDGITPLPDTLSSSFTAHNSTRIGIASLFNPAKGIIQVTGSFGYTGKDQVLTEIVILGTDSQQKKFKSAKLVRSFTYAEKEKMSQFPITYSDLNLNTMASLLEPFFIENDMIKDRFVSIDEFDPIVSISGNDMIISRFSLPLASSFQIHVE